ncbi:MAG: nucleotidyltransferase domain-containing protein [Ruminococcus sp.]|nr:MAG: nucleotidyltransferase domain-containing protein [Ruminococcus sp.]
MVKDFVQKVFEENGVNADIHGAAVTGSRSRGLENADSDIDVVIEVNSDLKEDVLFNIIHDEEFTLSGCTIDINPIKADETGTLETYLPTAEAYLTEKKHRTISILTLMLPSSLLRTILTVNLMNRLTFLIFQRFLLLILLMKSMISPIQVYADLEQFRLIYEYDGNVVRNEQYNSLAEMNKKMLCRYLISVTLYHFPMMRFLSVIQAKSDEPLHSESEIKAPEKAAEIHHNRL